MLFRPVWGLELSSVKSRAGSSVIVNSALPEATSAASFLDLLDSSYTAPKNSTIDRQAATTAQTFDQSPAKLASLKDKPAVQAATSTDLALCSPAAFTLDGVEPLDSLSFPNSPRKAGLAVVATLPNVQHMLDAYGITARYDVIAKKLLIGLPGHAGTLDNYDEVAMTTVISLADLNGLSATRIPSVIVALGDRHQFNPVLDWIRSCPWDGETRLADVYATLTEQPDFPASLKKTLIYRWLLSATAAVVKSDGFKTRGVLTLQGAQGLGKTQWIRSLVSDQALRQRVIRTDHTLDGTKDSQLGAIRHWIVELGEVESSLKDISKLKSFVTGDMDKIRPPYGRTESEFQRRTVFAATVNDHEFLVDPTGNTRFWTLPVVGIDHKHSIDMQQVFAELAEHVLRGEQWWLTAEEEALLELHNREHQTVSVIRERVTCAIDVNRIGINGLPAMTPTEVLQAIGIKDPTNPQARDCGAALRELLGESKKINGHHRWRVPLIDQVDNIGFTNQTTHQSTPSGFSDSDF